MLEHLNEVNDIKVYSILDKEFLTYGRIINDIDTAEIVSVAESIPMAEGGCEYTASNPQFEKLDIAKAIKEVFGQSECQIGYCHGHNHMLNSLEWHTCNEVNIATTDAVLILAKRYDMDENYHMNSKSCKAFFVPKGAAIEVYSDTLHYCPCEVTHDGYGMVVGLIKGTNTPQEYPSCDVRLRAKNKWVITHEDNTAAIKNGTFCGISGMNYKISY